MNICNTTSAGAIVHLQPDVVLPNENVLTFSVIRKEPRTFGDVKICRDGELLSLDQEVLLRVVITLAVPLA